MSLLCYVEKNVSRSVFQWVMLALACMRMMRCTKIYEISVEYVSYLRHATFLSHFSCWSPSHG